MYTPCDICFAPLAPVLWGHPGFYPESIYKLAENKQLIIGGSCFPDNGRNSYCFKCEKYYEKYAEIPDNLF
jgi:hypothetical protein